ncbi:hypothetical protein Godav_021377 [Gossypium davidsonii]|uniref:Zinc knuckle CX2CX4HX4C domain-containing protein n=1 Tax=Gossypium davidsonii TaxID=34287 RepID=A0A7J8R6W0_GOSDV|nr:hypothetical protein [Gossypium davidsonii]
MESDFQILPLKEKEEAELLAKGENPENIELPPRLASINLAKSLGGLIGTSLNYDASNKRNVFNSFMHIHVPLDIREPLMRKKKIQRQVDNVLTISFSYELVCYLCCRIGPSETSCRKLLDMWDGVAVREWPEEITTEFCRKMRGSSVQ